MNQKGFVNITLVVVIVVLVGVVGYFTFVKKSKPIVQQPTPTSTTTPTKTFTPIPISTSQDGTVNWKIYSNSEYGFQFKYPSNWRLYDAIQNPTWSGDSYKIRVSYRRGGGVSSPTYCQARPTDQRCQKTQIDGNEAIIDWGGSEGNEVSIDISDKDRGLIILYIMNYAPAEKSTIDQILSTFKFTK